MLRVAAVITFLIGLWLIASPFVLPVIAGQIGLETTLLTAWNAIICGAIVALSGLASWLAVPGRTYARAA